MHIGREAREHRDMRRQRQGGEDRLRLPRVGTTIGERQNVRRANRQKCVGAESIDRDDRDSAASRRRNVFAPSTGSVQNELVEQ